MEDGTGRYRIGRGDGELGRARMLLEDVKGGRHGWEARVRGREGTRQGWNGGREREGPEGRQAGRVKRTSLASHSSLPEAVQSLSPIRTELESLYSSPSWVG